MPEKKLIIPLTKTSDAQFRKALARREKDFPEYDVVDVRRTEKTEDGKTVPCAVIVLRL